MIITKNLAYEFLSELTQFNKYYIYNIPNNAFKKEVFIDVSELSVYGKNKLKKFTVYFSNINL